MCRLQEIELENKNKIISALKNTVKQHQEEMNYWKDDSEGRENARKQYEKMYRETKQQLQESNERIKELEEYEFMYKELSE